MSKIYLMFLLCFSVCFTFAQEEEETIPKTTTTTETTSNKKGKIQYDSLRYHVKGSHNFNFGIGYPNLGGAEYATTNLLTGILNDLTVNEIEKGGTTPDFNIKYEYGLTKDIGIGLHMGYFTAKTPTYEQLDDILEIFGDGGTGGGVVDDFLCNLLGIDCGTPTSGDTTYVEVEGGTYYQRIHSVSLAGRLAYHRKVFDDVDIYASTIVGYQFIKSKDKRSGSFINEALGDTKIPTNFIYFVSGGARYFVSPKVGIYAEFGWGTVALFNAGVTYRILPKEKPNR